MATKLYMQCFLTFFLLHCVSSSAIPTYTVIKRQRADNPTSLRGSPPPPPTLPPLSLPLDVYGMNQPGPYWRTVFERNIAKHDEAQRNLDKLRESRQGLWGIDLPSDQPYYNFINSPPVSRKSTIQHERHEDLRDPVIEERHQARDTAENPEAVEIVNSDQENIDEEVGGAGTPKPPASLKADFVNWLQDLVLHYTTVTANRLFEDFLGTVKEAFEKVDNKTPDTTPQLETSTLPLPEVESKYNVRKEIVELDKYNAKDLDEEKPTNYQEKGHPKNRRHKPKPSIVEESKKPVSSSSVKPEYEEKRDQKETNIEKYTDSQKVVNIFIFYPTGGGGALPEKLAGVEISPIQGQSNIFINGNPSNVQPTKLPESTTASANSVTIAEETFTNKVDNKPDPSVENTPSSTIAISPTLESLTDSGKPEILTSDSESSTAIVSSTSTVSETPTGLDEKEEPVNKDETEEIPKTNPNDDEVKTNEQELADAVS